MCEVISVAVHPVTAEVFHAPGMWHHTQICAKFGLDHDGVFKPEIRLNTLDIEFPFGPIAIKRRLPPELLREILFRIEAQGGQCEEATLNLSYEWTQKHTTAVNKWFAAHASQPNQLIDFSEHTYHWEGFKGTLLPQEFATDRELRKRGYRRLPNTSMSKDEWREFFEIPAFRSPAWKQEREKVLVVARP